MIAPFTRAEHWITVSLSGTERVLLSRLADELVELLASASTSETLTGAGPLLARLLPDAYLNDPEASAEFRRFTQPDLIEAKTSRLRVAASMAGALEAGDRGDESVTTTLDDEAALDLLRSLTDLRIAVAERLGIHADGDTPRTRDEFLLHVYDWLAYLQDSLVTALDG